ncbi:MULTISPECIES: phage portal protein [unclassified Cryobacterium]|uniref:phage portal protein n=1 Tax=unclassified Cryobacterium TaxID=2649013 RepID=UPI00106C0DDD|nr:MULTISPECIES: phage portal protein [unclassified Cryobacterium]TFC59421.1 phage portal protein [Cryobacterium sp. TMB3-1-2]TFC67217.1 phage portal protein [Cryobacterium sp. TMB3-15]TFC73270.1 phage portal protein [Cryobacterium sp. TMB3-10]TFD46158.1 phage portal protein [Cryobacterium sp. TMB3-12]
MVAQWPPAPMDEAFRQLAIYDAWYSNELESLPDNGGALATHTHRGQPYSGGLVGAVSGAVFGSPVGENRSSLTVPVAGDLAQLSSDLLFAESPTFTLPGSADVLENGVTVKADPKLKLAQARLELIMSSDAAHATLLRAGEYAAAHGWTYLSVVWDKTFRSNVWFRAFRADCVIPEWKYGELAAATLWTEYARADDRYRLLERHEPGFITYSLWKGEDGEKGRQVRLDAISETAHYLNLLPVVDGESLPMADTMDVVRATGVPYLTVEHMPNALPHPVWDRKGDLANLGRSDYFGIDSMLSKINALWSSLMRDFDNGMGRVIVPESMLKLNGPGKGAQFDQNRQFYSPLGGLVDDGAGGMITISQFNIRVQDHLDGIVALKREIAQKAGYSISHFGIHDGGTKTATEVTDDRSDSERTRDKKALYARPALARLARTALAIDGLVFVGKGGDLLEVMPDIKFAEVSQVNPLVRAQTTQTEMLARVRSVISGVRAVQPDLDEIEVAAEVALIKEENGMAAEADPTRITD